MSGPDILQIIRQIPHLYELVTSLYDCEYKNFFRAVVCLNESILNDRYLSVHAWATQG